MSQQRFLRSINSTIHLTIHEMERASTINQMEHELTLTRKREKKEEEKARYLALYKKKIPIDL